jgi:hypothetical protein
MNTIDKKGKRLQWQCGCRDSGGVMVQQWRPSDPDIDRMIAALKEIAAMNGCECDDYHGHRCLMCKVRAKAQQAIGKY